MEHTLFSLPTKADKRIWRYEHNGSFIEITPSVLGVASIHDKDVLIYVISQTIAALNEIKTAEWTTRHLGEITVIHSKSVRVIQ